MNEYLSDKYTKLNPQAQEEAVSDSNNSETS